MSLPKTTNNSQLEEQINGCDKMSRVYGKMFQFLQELMQDEEKFKELTPIDYSALGMYMGKFVEQEINSSVVQIMRAFCGIEMPEYYCKFCPDFDIDADVEYKNRRIRLNEHNNPPSPHDTLRSITLGDAYYALRQLKEEDKDGFFDDYPWLNDKKFLESWRMLFNYRNRMAHIGEIIDADTLKDNYRQFLTFLSFMPNILKTKKELAPDEYIEEIAPITKKEEYKPFFTSEYSPDKPYAPREIAEQYCKLQELLKDPEERDKSVETLNEILSNYCLDAIIFKGEDGKQGMKDCLGNLLVPANYDGFDFIPKPLEIKRNGVIAIREGRYVIVTLDGTGSELTKDTYDEIRLASYENPSSPYIFRKNGLSAWGFMNYMGDEITDCIADRFFDQQMYAYYSSGDLWGYWEYYYKVLLPPIYDNIESECEPEGLLLFTLNGKQGYVKYDGSFISLDDYNNLDEDEQWDVRSECIIDMLMDY